MAGRYGVDGFPLAASRELALKWEGGVGGTRPFACRRLATASDVGSMVHSYAATGVSPSTKDEKLAMVQR